MRRNLQGRQVVVTGAARGIGAAVARTLAGHGAVVHLADLDVPGMERVHAQITESGAAGTVWPLDARDESQWSAIASGIGKAPVHGLVNCAGIALRKGVEDTTPEEWERVLRVNLTAPYLAIRALLPALASAHGASVVNVASIAGRVGYFAAAYAASKWGLRGLTQAAALELADHHIRVNAVLPGLIDTPLLTAGDPRFVESSVASIPMARTGSPEELAEVVLFLLSDASTYLTGAEIVVDGGLSSGGLYRRILAGMSEVSGDARGG